MHDGDVPMVDLLIRHGANVNARQGPHRLGHASLHMAVAQQNIDVVRRLCRSPDIDCSMRAVSLDDLVPKTPLEIASSGGYQALIEVLEQLMAREDPPVIEPPSEHPSSEDPLSEDQVGTGPTNITHRRLASPRDAWVSYKKNGW